MTGIETVAERRERHAALARFMAARPVVGLMPGGISLLAPGFYRQTMFDEKKGITSWRGVMLRWRQDQQVPPWWLPRGWGRPA